MLAIKVAGSWVLGAPVLNTELSFEFADPLVRGWGRCLGSVVWGFWTRAGAR